MGIYKAVLVAFEKYKFNKIFLKNKLDNNVYLIWLKIIFLLQLCIEYNYIDDDIQPPPHPIIQHLKAFLDTVR